MMKKNGFTLIELLAVIVLIAVVAVLGSYGVRGAQRQIKKDIWQSKYSLIITRAKTFGEDNKNYFMDKQCPNFGNKAHCLEITVQTLIDRRYLSTKDVDGDGNKAIVNESYPEDKVSKINENTCYYVNTWPIYVYVEDNMVYAKLVTPSNCS